MALNRQDAVSICERIITDGSTSIGVTWYGAVHDVAGSYVYSYHALSDVGRRDAFLTEVYRTMLSSVSREQVEAHLKLFVRHSPSSCAACREIG